MAVYLAITLHVWALVAYLAAAVAGFRATVRLAGDIPPWPPCIVIDSTRWLFGHGPHRQWEPEDYWTVGVLFTSMAAAMLAVTVVMPLLEIKARPESIEDAAAMIGASGTLSDIARRIAHVAMGSGLIILHAGAAMAAAHREERDNAA